jgi:acyl carrier protein
MAGDTQQEEGIDFTSTKSEQLVQLVELFKEVLMQQHVNASSDFFELGGSSLTAMTLAALARKRFDLKLEVTDVYELATPLGIAKSWNSLKSRTANKLDSSSVIKKKQRWE